jgi:hypothetical protein
MPRMVRVAFIALLLGLVACEQRVTTCEEAVHHMAGIMKRSKDESRRRFWSDEKVVAGQIRFCKNETPNLELRQCVIDESTEAGLERCIETLGGPR